MLKCKTQNYRRSLCQNVTSLVSIGQYFSEFSRTNDGNNLTTRFPENKSKPLFNADLLPAVLPWQRHSVQSDASACKIKEGKLKNA